MPIRVNLVNVPERFVLKEFCCLKKIKNMAKFLLTNILDNLKSLNLKFFKKKTLLRMRHKT
jgi:hypothetical protein